MLAVRPVTHLSTTRFGLNRQPGNTATVFMIRYWYKPLVARQGKTRDRAGKPQLSHTPTTFAPRLGGSQVGMTLVELMLVLVMASIVLTLGVPSFQALIQRNRLTAETNRFVTSMMLARSEAVKRNTATGMVAKSNDWSNGWVVWVDTDDDGAQGTGELVLRTEEAADSTVTLSGSVTAFQYASDGTLNTTGSLNVCDGITTGGTGRQISLALTGHVSVDPKYTCP